MRKRGFVLPIMLFLIILGGCSSSLTAMLTPTPTTLSYSLAGGGACVQLGTKPQAPYTNVRVSQDTFLAHSEPMLVQNPNNPLNLVGGSKFFTDPAHYRFKIGFYSSFDGGCTWQDGGVLPGFQNERLTSDISFAFGLHNDVYAAVLNNTGAAESGISVSASTDGGKTFASPVSVFDDRTGNTFADKPWIGIDNTAGPLSGNLYVVWSYDHFDCAGQGFCTQELGFSRSKDGGKTFSKVQLVEGSAPFCTNPADGRPSSSRKCDGALGAIPAVLPDGTLAIAYAYISLTNTYIPTKLLVTTTPNGGTTWTTPVDIASVVDLPSPLKGERYRTTTLPAFAADPNTGQLYIAWNDFGHGDADILLATSTDKGRTWTKPLRVNDDPIGNGAQQFQPQLAVAPNGVVSVSFFDTRTDPAHLLIDEFLAQSTNHAQSFLPNVRVTTQSWDPKLDQPTDSNGQGFIGDYQGLSADNLFVHPFWNDTRTGSQEIFTAAIPSAQP